MIGDKQRTSAGRLTRVFGEPDTVQQTEDQAECGAQQHWQSRVWAIGNLLMISNVGSHRF